MPLRLTFLLLCCTAVLPVNCFAQGGISEPQSSLKSQKAQIVSSQRPQILEQGKKLPLPVKPTRGELSSTFGARKLPGQKKTTLHAGIDLRAQKGTPVLASGCGTVRFVGKKGAYGQTIEIDHGEGLVTRYAHLDKYAVKPGQQIKSGTQIGTVGTTGRTTGANLHFEVVQNGKPINPLRFSAWAKTTFFAMSTR